MSVLSGHASRAEPVLDAIEEADARDAELRAEAAARAKTVRRSLRAIGFRAGSTHERIAVLIALAAGHKTLRRTISAIAEDRDVNRDRRRVEDALVELEEFGVIHRAAEPPSPAKRRGRPATVWLVALRWDFLRQMLAEHERHEAKNMALAESSDLWADDGQSVGTTQADDGQTTGKTRAEDGQKQNYTAYYPSSQIPGPYSPGPSTNHSNETSPATSGQTDQKCLDVSWLDRESVEPTARRLFGGLAYRGDQGQTLWHVAAAFDAGLIAEADIADSVRAAYECRARDPVAYFRRSLAERLGGGESDPGDREALRSVLAKVRIRGGLPGRPPSSGKSHAVVPQAPPPAMPRQINHQSFYQQLAGAI